MTTEEIEKRISKIKANMKARHTRYATANAKDYDELQSLQIKLAREELKRLIGITGAVQLRTRYRDSDQLGHLRDAYGTVISVRRKRCSVNFGDNEVWNLVFDEVCEAHESQAHIFGLPSDQHKRPRHLVKGVDLIAKTESV